ncbi:hypothetical protein [Sphingorhabdus sp. Alg231-15]|uniref:hypothetical protein n=1 Tax=Sphingorhabdus sp. Alg231-15 TaxID=1922222 RepID=UPI000D5535C4
MFGPRLTRVFASRANALWWSAMVLVTAYCVAAEPPVTSPEGKGASNVIKEVEEKKPVDPWADETFSAGTTSKPLR